MTGIPERLPAGLAAYARTADFTPGNLPAKLQAAHATKPGTWGLLQVLEGRLRFTLEPPRSGERVAGPDEKVVIETEVPHHVAFVEPGRFFITFYRRPAGQ